MSDYPTAFADADEARISEAFPPFEETIVCPGCNRPLQMMLQPLHNSIEIRCPRCVRQLTPLIRRAIRRHAQAGAHRF
jgi:uncharacterized paraquat-inducible protein A